MVNVSAVCTPADAAAGGTPMLISKVLEICPNAMPSAPSTICAAKPIATKGRRTLGSARNAGKMVPSHCFVRGLCRPTPLNAGGAVWLRLGIPLRST